jgi:hypothetical protein
VCSIISFRWKFAPLAKLGDILIGILTLLSAFSGAGSNVGAAAGLFPSSAKVNITSDPTADILRFFLVDCASIISLLRFDAVILTTGRFLFDVVDRRVFFGFADDDVSSLSGDDIIR